MLCTSSQYFHWVSLVTWYLSSGSCRDKPEIQWYCKGCGTNYRFWREFICKWNTLPKLHLSKCWDKQLDLYTTHYIWCPMLEILACESSTARTSWNHLLFSCFLSLNMPFCMWNGQRYNEGVWRPWGGANCTNFALKFTKILTKKVLTHFAYLSCMDLPCFCELPKRNRWRPFFWLSDIFGTWRKKFSISNCGKGLPQKFFVVGNQFGPLLSAWERLPLLPGAITTPLGIGRPVFTC